MRVVLYYSTHPQEYVPWGIEAGCVDASYFGVAPLGDDAAREPRYRTLNHFIVATFVPRYRVHYHEIDGSFTRTPNLEVTKTKFDVEPNCWLALNEIMFVNLKRLEFWPKPTRHLPI